MGRRGWPVGVIQTVRPHLNFAAYRHIVASRSCFLEQIPVKTELDPGLNLNSPGVITTDYWRALDDGRLQCDLCPRACKLRERQRGLCFVRARLQDQVVMTSYGRSSGFCVDPIEKNPLNHFLPGSAVLSFGTAGCNLACKFCQNWDISKSRQMDRLMDSASPEQIAERAQQLGCRSVAFTYNDPVIFHEYAIDVAAACRERGLKSVAVTAAYICEEPCREFFAAMDAANIDLKAFNEDFYFRMTGAHLQPVLDNLIYLKEQTSLWFELTTLLIPGINDDRQQLEAMTQWIVDKLGPEQPLHFTAFHPDYKMLDVPATPPSTLIRAREIALASGLCHVYVGNVHDAAHSSSYCRHCGECVLERDWYQLGRSGLSNDGHCLACGGLFAGVIDGPVENWGARRQPVIMQP